MPDYRLFKVKDIPKSCIQTCYCILRVGKSLKSMQQIKGFENHMERKTEVLNADNHISNLLIKGSTNIVKDAEEYLKDCSYKVGRSMLGKEMLLTASPDFFKYASQDDIYKWVEVNLEFLNKEYGDNCIYANVHFDENSPHANALIIPRFPHEFKTTDKKFKLVGKTYFGGREILAELQDRYANFMNDYFPILQRGIKGSTAKHTEIKRFYGMIREEKQATSQEDTHRYNLYLRTNLKQTEGILNAYKEHTDKLLKEKDELLMKNMELEKEIKKLNENIKKYQKTIDKMKEKEPKTYENIIAKIEDMFSDRKEIGR